MEAKNKPPGTSTGEKTLLLLNQAAVDKLCILFRNAHALAKHCRPFTDFVWMSKLDKIKGLYVGQTYLTDVKCREFIDSIANVERGRLEQRVRSAPYISISCDEATDSSIKEQLIIYVRYMYIYYLNISTGIKLINTKLVIKHLNLYIS